MYLLKSLTYFEDAEKGKMPKMLKEVSWNDVKKSINEVVDNYMNSFNEDQETEQFTDKKFFGITAEFMVFTE